MVLLNNKRGLGKTVFSTFTILLDLGLVILFSSSYKKLDHAPRSGSKASLPTAGYGIDVNDNYK